MEQRWSEPPDCSSPPSLTGVLQKTSLLRASSSYAPRYLALFTEHLYSYPAAYTPEEPSPPLSRIHLKGLVVLSNKDDPNGFVLAPAGAEFADAGKVKFVCADVDTKRLWVEALHLAIREASAVPQGSFGNVSNASSASRPAFATDRSSKPLKDGVLEKRDGNRFSSYHPRWVEVRRGVGLLYGKFRSSPDESFKRIPLLDQVVSTNVEKFRFSVVNEAGVEIFFRCSNAEDFASWLAAVEQEVHPLRTRDGRRMTAQEIEQLRAAGGYVFASDLGNSSTSFPASAPTTYDGGGDMSLGDGAAVSCFPGLTQLFHSSKPHRDTHHSSANTSLTTSGRCTPLEELRIYDEYTTFELDDLMSEVPLQFHVTQEGQDAPSPSVAPPESLGTSVADLVHLERKLFPKKRLKPGVKVYLESVSCLYDPHDDSEEFHEHLPEILQQRVTYGVTTMVDRLKDRMYTPFIDETYTALNEHIVLLDLDTQELRKTLSQLLQEFGNEEGLRAVAVSMDDVLRQYTHVRELLVVRRNIAAFRCQRDFGGLKLGIDGTLEFINKLVTRDRGAPTEVNYKRVLQMYQSLYQCFDDFRLEFDAFDVSRDAIEEIELGLVRTAEWLAINEPLVGADNNVTVS